MARTDVENDVVRVREYLTQPTLRGGECFALKDPIGHNPRVLCILRQRRMAATVLYGHRQP